MRLVGILRFVCVEELKEVTALQKVLHPQAGLTDPGKGKRCVCSQRSAPSFTSFSWNTCTRVPSLASQTNSHQQEQTVCSCPGPGSEICFRPQTKRLRAFLSSSGYEANAAGEGGGGVQHV